MRRIEQLFNQLGYTRDNGLFYLEESADWVHKFPYRISKVLRDIIKPFAFYSLHHHGILDSEHPEPINNPIILFFEKPDEDKRKEIPKWSFCFGQAPIVIINTADDEPLDIFHGYSFASEGNYLLEKIDAQVDEFNLVNLTLGKTWKKLYHEYFKNVPKVDKYLLNNIIDARRILIASDGGNLPAKIANRLIGRLLFIRYLIDRRVEFKDQNYIIGEGKVNRQVSLNELIKNKEALYGFFHYLTEKYKGDLFPLSEEDVDEETGEILIKYEEESAVNADHLEVLYHLFAGSSFFKSGSVHKGYTVQPSLFMVYDFEVIPVELISNIYENFIGKEAENVDVLLTNYKPTKQFEIKAYYTPPFVVDYILSQTVAPYIESQTIASCKVLDPACGSGIFLVETLRKVIEKEILILAAKGQKISNSRLWELLRENIYGIDIDEDAIEITIFSLYITLLDYKTPIEIEDFKFEKLRGINLFGGTEYDFFNDEASFNELFTKEVALDFILGNPPWGTVGASRYEQYIKSRNLHEATNLESERGQEVIIRPDLKLELGNREISQAFLVRVSDFAINPHLQIAMIVTGKSLYNSDSTCKNWREYFLSNFQVNQVLELSCVNNKIVAGNQIFEEAKQSPAILFFKVAKKPDDILRNIVTHITVKPNRFFNYFRTIVIEKHDIKKILQRNFIRGLDGYDWLWKVMLHGNLLDFYFMKRLKAYKTIEDLMYTYNLEAKGGLKVKDGDKKKDTDEIRHYKFLNVEGKEFNQYSLMPTLTWDKTVESMRKKFVNNKQGLQKRNNIDSDGKVGYLPPTYFFRGEKLLVKKGLMANEDFKAVAAYDDGKMLFTATVCAIKTKEGHDIVPGTTELLKSLTAIINSRFFTYYVFNTSSSAGVDRTRIDFEEIFSAPAIINPLLATLVDEIQQLYKQINATEFETYENQELNARVNALKEKSQNHITKLFEINAIEQSLIDYATEIAIPILKRAEETGYGNKDNIFKMLSINNDCDREYLREYANIFIDHFKHRFNTQQQSFYTNIHIADDFIGFHFIVDKLPESGEVVTYRGMDDSALLNELGFLGIHSVTRDLYIQQDVRGFNKNTFYIIKPNERKCWHRAVANHDLLEFIDALARAESSNQKSVHV